MRDSDALAAQQQRSGLGGRTTRLWPGTTSMLRIPRGSKRRGQPCIVPDKGGFRMVEVRYVVCNDALRICLRHAQTGSSEPRFAALFQVCGRVQHGGSVIGFSLECACSDSVRCLGDGARREPPRGARRVKSGVVAADVQPDDAPNPPPLPVPHCPNDAYRHA